LRLLWNRLIGFLVIFIGISIVVNIIGFGTGFLGAFFLFGIGVILYRHVHHWVGIFVIALAIIALFGVFHIDLGGILIAAVFIYIGYRLFKGQEIPFINKRNRRERKHERRKEHRSRRANRRAGQRTEESEEDWIDEEIETLRREQQKKKEFDEPCTRMKTPRFRNSLIGDLHLTKQRFELDDMNMANGIGDVKIDLSKAIIPEGESTIAISGLIGDIDIYVPYDLEASVAGSVTFGELEVLGNKQSGISRQLNLETKGYRQADRKVKISVSVFIGDIDVRYI
jgi:lia operon protein LiaF